MPSVVAPNPQVWSVLDLGQYSLVQIEERLLLSRQSVTVGRVFLKRLSGMFKTTSCTASKSEPETLLQVFFCNFFRIFWRSFFIADARELLLFSELLAILKFLRCMCIYYTYIINCIYKYRANIYLFKVNDRNPRKRCGICSKLTIKTPERHRSDICIVNFEHISHHFLAFLLLTLNK